MTLGRSLAYSKPNLSLLADPSMFLTLYIAPRPIHRIWYEKFPGVYLEELKVCREGRHLHSSHTDH